MTLIVTRSNHNPLRASKLFPEIIKIAKERGLKTIGHCYIGKDDPQDKSTLKWVCHKCDAKNPKPQIETEILTECPSCKYPFLLTLI